MRLRAVFTRILRPRPPSPPRSAVFLHFIAPAAATRTGKAPLEQFRAQRQSERWSARINSSSMPSRKPRSAMRMRSDGKAAADAFENGAARQHQIGAIGTDAGVLRRARHRTCARSLFITASISACDIHKSIDAPPVIARQVEMHAGQRRHRARRAEQMKTLAALLLGRAGDEMLQFRDDQFGHRVELAPG